jgi:hypothetical protein
MQFTTQQIISATPGMLGCSSLPVFTQGNLARDRAVIPNTDPVFDPRRNYWSAVASAFGGASNSGASVAYKKRCATHLTRYFDLLKKNYLTGMDVNRLTYNKEGKTGHYYEHLFPDAWVMWATLYDVTFQPYVINRARWLLDDEENGGMWKDGIDGYYSFRAEIRRIFELVCLHEAEFLDQKTRIACARLATQKLEAINTSRAKGKNKILEGGWASAKNVLYTDIGASHQHGQRIIHMYFLSIFGDLMLRIKHTNYYNQNKTLVDSIWGKLKTTMQTVVETSSSTFDLDGNLAEPNMFNLREDEYALDRTVSGKNVVYSGDFDNPESRQGFPAYRLWALYKTLADFNQSINESSAVWLPSLQDYPEVIVAYNYIKKGESGVVKQKSINTSIKYSSKPEPMGGLSVLESRLMSARLSINDALTQVRSALSSIK